MRQGRDLRRHVPFDDVAANAARRRARARRADVAAGRAPFDAGGTFLPGRLGLCPRARERPRDLRPLDAAPCRDREAKGRLADDHARGQRGQHEADEQAATHARRRVDAQPEVDAVRGIGRRLVDPGVLHRQKRERRRRADPGPRPYHDDQQRERKATRRHPCPPCIVDIHVHDCTHSPRRIRQCQTKAVRRGALARRVSQASALAVPITVIVPSGFAHQTSSCARRREPSRTRREPCRARRLVPRPDHVDEAHVELARREKASP